MYSDPLKDSLELQIKALDGTILKEWQEINNTVDSQFSHSQFSRNSQFSHIYLLLTKLDVYY